MPEATGNQCSCGGDIMLVERSDDDSPRRDALYQVLKLNPEQKHIHVSSYAYECSRCGSRSEIDIVSIVTPAPSRP